jgi:hypothetical protein
MNTSRPCQSLQVQRTVDMDVSQILEAVLIPVVGALGVFMYKALTAFAQDRINNTRNEAFRSLWSVALTVVQSTFRQIIEPAWKEFKANPDDQSVKMRYENALKLAKARATEQLNDHINKLPDLIADFLRGKVDDVIESAIPAVKAVNKNPTEARSNLTA